MMLTMRKPASTTKNWRGAMGIGSKGIAVNPHTWQPHIRSRITDADKNAECKNLSQLQPAEYWGLAASRSTACMYRAAHNPS